MIKTSKFLKEQKSDEFEFTVSTRNEQTAQKLANLFKALEICNCGASRSFKIFWDGDGSDHLNIINTSIEPEEMDTNILEKEEPINVS